MISLLLWFPASSCVIVCYGSRAFRALCCLHVCFKGQMSSAGGFRRGVFYLVLRLPCFIDATVVSMSVLFSLFVTLFWVISHSPLDQFMEFHNRNYLFRERFVPDGFCVAIGRQGQAPEGTLSIVQDANYLANQKSGTTDGKPIHTFTACMELNPADDTTVPFSFSLNAAARLSFYGRVYVHGHLRYVFDTHGRQARQRLKVCARARQFSSFILLIGTITGASTFSPIAALLMKDKDDLQIPLMLETIPSPKVCDPHIASLFVLSNSLRGHPMSPTLIFPSSQSFFVEIKN